MVDGYQISYTPESVITHYGVVVSGREIATLEDDYRSLVVADPKSIRRPANLQGLSPWNERRAARTNVTGLAAEAQGKIQQMDERGAWTKTGTIGRDNRLVFPYAAKDIVLRIGRGRSDGSAGEGQGTGSQIIQLKENDTVEIFAGSQAPRKRL